MTTNTLTDDRDRAKLVEARTLNVALMEQLEEVRRTKQRISNREVRELARTVRKLADLPVGSDAAMKALDRAFVLADRIAA